MVPGPVASVLPGNLLEMHILRPQSTELGTQVWAQQSVF